MDNAKSIIKSEKKLDEAILYIKLLREINITGG